MTPPEGCRLKMLETVGKLPITAVEFGQAVPCALACSNNVVGQPSVSGCLQPTGKR